MVFLERHSPKVLKGTELKDRLIDPISKRSSSSTFDSVVVNIQSSYKQNALGELFYDMVRDECPEHIVEIGCLEGYSLLHMIKAVEEHNYSTRIDVYDLWKSYQYKHNSMEIPKSNITKAGLDNSIVSFHKSDAFEVATDFSNNSVDILHLDISNDGDKLEKIIVQWKDIIKPGGIFIFEGGSKERDNIDWMIKYGKTPIRKFIENSKALKQFNLKTVEVFPSLTICRRKKDVTTS